MRRRYMHLKEPRASPRSEYILVQFWLYCIQHIGWVIWFSGAWSFIEQIQSWALAKDHCIFILIRYVVFMYMNIWYIIYICVLRERPNYMHIQCYNIHICLLSLLHLCHFLFCLFARFSKSYATLHKTVRPGCRVSNPRIGRIYTRW